jgi:ketosteroid isomerase-like protein
VEIVRALIEAWSRGEYAAAMDVIDEEIELDVAYGTDLDGSYHGRQGLQEFLGAFWGEFRGPQMEVEEAFANGNDVVCGVHLSGRGRTSGITVDASAWHVWRLRGKKAVRWQIFRTKPQALHAAGLSE